MQIYFDALCSNYPCPIEKLILNTIITLRNKYKCEIGYSGHESDVSPSIMAYFLGCKIYRKTYYFRRSMWGTDQSASLSYTGMKNLADILSKAPLILGNGVKKYLKKKK